MASTTPTSNTGYTVPSTATDITHLTKTSLPVPVPGPQQVLVRLTAAALNYRDFLIASRSPRYPGSHKADLVPGSDGAGAIHSAHPSSRFASNVGLSVAVHPNSWLDGDVRNLKFNEVLGGFSADGTLQEYLVVDDEQIIPAPKGWKGEEVAGLFTAGTTAWAAIRELLDGRLDGTLGGWEGDWKEKRLEGKWVLTQGTGGVSCAAIQIASTLGATVIATSSSDEKLDIAKSIGAKYVINYKKTPEWDEEVLRITGGTGVDQVIEVGGAQTIIQSLRSTRPGGLISVIGILSDADIIPPELIPAVLFGGKIVKGCVSFSRDISAEFVKFSEVNNFKPVVSKIFSFDQVVESFEALQKQNSVGKLVVRISED
ncbi:hypothetical protein BU24DRAFT_407262 [Aaosphaeria arxii CBS 175.79]|uniref:Enoyl reductase (ER) domain-containing protein n=1 Tax=Aaosphaeria arxii CBS 175.79 TaxID=1450172 RepID=A0A6A5XWA2_9PLEO|nr:uncharacterized protein BU24DRAFT_407262 [Aaosphaeria arxii CBS 175.79]KAF2017203.1 hypothetical protein BU24DRAFT_407262 [Aaosphaeria arxii CBS 175.79]